MVAIAAFAVWLQLLLFASAVVPADAYSLAQGKNAYDANATVQKYNNGISLMKAGFTVYLFCIVACDFMVISRVPPGAHSCWETYKLQECNLCKQPHLLHMSAVARGSIKGSNIQHLLQFFPCPTKIPNTVPVKDLDHTASRIGKASRTYRLI